MTTSLRKAFQKAGTLPPEAQKQLAAQLSEDIGGELNWDRALERSQPLLERMARKALKHRKSGRTVKRGFDEL